MFRSLRQSRLPKEHVFSVTVGASSKQTLASWHLIEPSDVISVLALLNETSDAEGVGGEGGDDGAVPAGRVE
jgi:trehalose 6-phosphate synthase/phosphatase